MRAEEIIVELENKYNVLLKWMENYHESDYFTEKIPGKWTAGQQIDHLLKSTKPLNKALRLPKLGLRTLFGKCNRPERSYEEVFAKYQAALNDGRAKATGRFAPDGIQKISKEELLSLIQKELKDLKEILVRWEEKDLSVYLIPHPVLGKMTIREMMYFTIFHTEHHFKQLQSGY